MALSAPGHRFRRVGVMSEGRARAAGVTIRRSPRTGLGVLVLLAIAISACGGSAAGAGEPSAIPPGAQAYVCNFAYEAHPGMTITPIDLSGPRPEHRVTVGSLPSAVAATPGGAELAVTTQGDDGLVLLDTASNTVMGRVTTGLEPDAVAITPDGKTAVVANFGDGTVSLVDLTTLRIDTTVAVGSQPDAVAITPDGTTAVVANFGDGTVSLVDLTTLHIDTTVAVGSQPDAVAITPDGTTAVVANFGDGTVSLVDLATMTAAAPVTVGPGPSAVVVSGAAAGRGATAWVGMGKSLVPVALARPVPGPAVAVGHIVEAVALADGGRTAWIASQGGAIFPVTLSTGRVGKSTAVAGQPSAIAVTPPAP